MKILIVQQKMIGDVLTSTILCENLKRAFPSCQIDFVANDNTLAVIEAHPYIDNIIIFKTAYRKNKRAFLSFLKSLKTTTYDVLIDVYGKTESNLITWFSSAKIKISYYKWYTRFLYTHPLKRYTKTDYTKGLAIKNRLLLLTPLLKKEQAPIVRPRIYLSKAEICQAEDILAQQGILLNTPLFMLNVLGSSPEKTYPLPYMASVIDTITANSKATLLFNYIPRQEKAAKDLYSLCAAETQARIQFSVFAPSLRNFLGILYHCQALIGNEGGAVNMAKALDIPTFSIFSPWIDKEAWDLFSDAKHVAVHVKDIMPEKYIGKSQKEIKKHTQLYYEAFTPNTFKAPLNNFLKTISSS